MFPRKMYRVVFSALMSLCMSFIMSGAITFLNLGLSKESLKAWLFSSFPKAWGLAFIVVLIIVPYVAKVAESLIKK